MINPKSFVKYSFVATTDLTPDEVKAKFESLFITEVFLENEFDNIAMFNDVELELTATEWIDEDRI